ncbi:tRNA uridine-5-carboxymethylaminomethyl(34) synthesis GTPase MnmE [Actibacterium ureilyticum]|uniref:tRNA uridine-5-carboxymethylaminomethyl(34) synthesis GTPase MnmE n=1 Tax=Actibacterium ureilyticum TaxID=1590614 RepID=UPI000BAB0B9D|nr:tRNA uridine-5-carboxymethylaminomethyl(34) synthesis GTPase MnmE [Actibacterium ureilyticum]
MDTIFALATARGKAGVAVIRISGPDAAQALAAFGATLPAPRRAALRQLSDTNGQPLDEALVLYFEAGASFTGEPVVELQIHGSMATAAAVLHLLSQVPGCREAEPGEFTRRALENERMDLTQVEGLADLIDAETEAQRRQALRVLSGAIGDRAEIWRARLIRAAALLEATIDFADEEVPVDVGPEVLSLIDEVSVDLTREAAGVGIAERIRDGFEVAIVGPPNAGKSTLLNALAGREAAITSDIPGTTRDVIEVRMDLAGLPVTVLDTAGLRETEDVIEGLGVTRARQRAEQADLRIFLIDAPGQEPAMPPLAEDIVVHSKSDLNQWGEGISISAKTGAGISELVTRISDVLAQRSAGAGVATRERHRLAIERALTSLDSARNQVLAGAEYAELAAEELRTAIRALDALVGRVDVENILDEIFSSFCIGK